MRVLVTGATGFTGKALSRRLIADGHQVVALDYKTGYKTEELRDLGVELHIGSVTDESMVARLMPGIDVVQHLAAAFRELDVTDDHYHEVNVKGTANVLKAALRERVKKFVYCSTCGVHGNVDDPPAAETAPIAPQDYYQRTKYEAEPLVLEYHDRGLPSTILRPAAIYGPGDPERFYMIFRRVAKGLFPMFGNGKTLYHPLYIDNFIDALLRAMDTSTGLGEAYLIADEEYVEIAQLVRRVARTMGARPAMPHLPLAPVVLTAHIVEKVCRPFGVKPFIFPRRVDWFRQNRAFDISKAKAELGYEPKVALDAGLRATYDWYRDEGLLE